MNKTLLVLACLVASTAWGDDCKYERNIERTLDLSGTSQLDINAAAGELRVVGTESPNEALIEARVCASDERWASESSLRTASGNTAEISVEVPDRESSWNGDNYFSVDLVIQIPAGMALNIKDTSGQVRVENSGDLSIRDSSGDIDIRDIQGMVNVEDSSGDIDMMHVHGDLVIEGDTSGNISGTDIRGSVLVMKDSSGNIRFENVQNDFIVERDSSGNIVADTIGGDFRVLKDGSGTIRAKDVTGEIDIPEKG
jgi:DUF4097 and DUF4098 domain-containing protein YvlB